MVMLFECQMCDPPEEWLGKSAPPEFRMSAPQQGWCICEKHVGELYEETWDSSILQYVRDEEGRYVTDEEGVRSKGWVTTEVQRPDSFTYTSYATLKPSVASCFCRRIFQIRLGCCLEDCKEEDWFVHLTGPTTIRWGDAPLEIKKEGGHLKYRERKMECCGVVHPLGDGVNPQHLHRPLCEEPGHVCVWCFRKFSGHAYTRSEGGVVLSEQGNINPLIQELEG